MKKLSSIQSDEIKIVQITDENVTKSFQNTESVILPTETPTTGSWSLEPLFKTAIQGKKRVWQVGFRESKLLMTYGFVDGEITTNFSEVITNSSGRSLQEQALLEARSRYNEYRRKFYAPAGGLPSVKYEVMLARNKVYSENDAKKLQFPVICQPKLDGVRATAHLSIDGNVVLLSRTNKAFSHITHFNEDLATILQLLPQGAFVDGELYIHGTEFNEISSVVRREGHENAGQLEYWLFDVYYTATDGAPYENRLSSLKIVTEQLPAKSKIKLVDSVLINSHEKILEYQSLCIEKGFEGCIIRKLANNLKITDKKFRECTYIQGGRVANLLKCKSEITEEGEVIGVENSSGTEEGAALLTIRDIRGNEMNIRFRGSVERRREWFRNPKLVLGKQATFKYQDLSEYGVPRFPVGIDLRDYE